MESNYIKEVCAKLGITQRELARTLGYSEEAISRAAKTNKVSNSMRKTIEGYLNQDLNKVKDICNKLDCTQEELALNIGVDKSSISEWSRGTRATPKWALRIFELLLVEKDYKMMQEKLRG
ncbi:hypothetical protein BKH43_05935 [Helicobacter sp. 13S00401-1]|uniref:helix-turn-helix transcriptional regulator n=1 Tax=Helicobacter sp. 13S00401-1 TaxID=1905758 RepID=UPI000BA55319|nr:helix-turn-helix transcriptional regulator [Helicobacter sp. 13S00401-1]PAF50147.1 hypothetical protein BKH43_05935 [Helicobacter sp. 13S00401-1]